LDFVDFEFEGMYFRPGKRKGYSSFKIIDRSNKNRRTTVKLPSALPPVPVQPVQEEIGEEEDGKYLCAGDDAESGEDEVSTSYQTRRERLSKNWEAVRLTLLKSSLQLEGLVPKECVEIDCSKRV